MNFGLIKKSTIAYTDSGGPFETVIRGTIFRVPNSGFSSNCADRMLRVTDCSQIADAGH